MSGDDAACAVRAFMSPGTAMKVPAPMLRWFRASSRPTRAPEGKLVGRLRRADPSTSAARIGEGLNDPAGAEARGQGDGRLDGASDAEVLGGQAALLVTTRQHHTGVQVRARAQDV